MKSLFNKNNYEIWYIKKNDKKIVRLTPDEIEKLIMES